MTTVPTRRRWLILAMTACAAATAATACAGGKGPRVAGETPTASASRANVLSADEIRRANISNVFDLVSTLRPRWMQTRGTDSFQRPTEIQVYVDNTRLSAGLNGLRDLPSLGVSRIEFVGPIEASARWGLDHGQGAIVVSTSAR